MRRRGAARAPMAAPPRAVPGSVGGYRVIRALGAGRRAAVYLAHNPEATPPTVAAKIAVSADGTPVADEVDALSGVASPHVVRLIDVWAADGCTALLLEPLTGEDLPAVLRRARPLAPGEAVTILVSVLRGVCALHGAGFAHGALAPPNVLFDESGRPVLAALGRAIRLDGPASDAAADDWERFAGLVATVLAHTQAFGRGPAVAAVSEAAVMLRSGDGTLEARAAQFEQTAFALAPAGPIRLEADAGPATPVRLPRDAAPRSPAAPLRSTRARPPDPVPAGAHERSGGRIRVAGLTAAAAELMERGLRPIVRETILARLRTHRRAVVIGVAACAGILAAGLLLMPDPPSHRDVRSPGATAASARTPRTVPAAPPEPARADTDPDDPVAAVARLLTRRDACLAGGGGECLLACDQAGSSLLERDTRSPGSSGHYGRHAPSLIERTGDAALLALMPPAGAAGGSDTSPAASVLAVKGEDGWRLRELYEG